jgi:hypothetical protein
MPSIYRGVAGVNRKIKEQYRGVAGVNRKIKEQYRVVDGVYRKVFAEEPIISINTYTLNLDKLIGSYELYDYDTYLFIRINGSHIDGPTYANMVMCGWEIKGLQIGDEVTFSYEFTTIPTGDSFAGLYYYDGTQYRSPLAGEFDKNASVTITCAGNLVRLLQYCGSYTTYNKFTKITSILLNGNQIYPII